MRYTLIDSPLGELLATGELLCAGDVMAAGELLSLTGLYLPTGRRPQSVQAGWTRDDAAFAAVRAQLGEYLAGTRRDFDLPLNAAGSPFQKRVWSALVAIPYGETTSYGRIAAAVASPDAARAVGLANGQNPISIVVPCHRVIGADGSLTGYGGGLDAKRWLLSHEASHAGLFAHPTAVPR